MKKYFLGIMGLGFSLQGFGAQDLEVGAQRLIPVKTTKHIPVPPSINIIGDFNTSTGFKKMMGKKGEEISIPIKKNFLRNRSPKNKILRWVVSGSTVNFSFLEDKPNFDGKKIQRFLKYFKKLENFKIFFNPKLPDSNIPSERFYEKIRTTVQRHLRRSQTQLHLLGIKRSKHIERFMSPKFLSALMGLHIHVDSKKPEETQGYLQNLLEPSKVKITGGKLPFNEIPRQLISNSNLRWQELSLNLKTKELDSFLNNLKSPDFSKNLKKISLNIFDNDDEAKLSSGEKSQEDESAEILDLNLTFFKNEDNFDSWLNFIENTIDRPYQGMLEKTIELLNSKCNTELKLWNSAKEEEDDRILQELILFI